MVVSKKHNYININRYVQNFHYSLEEEITFVQQRNNHYAAIKMLETGNHPNDQSYEDFEDSVMYNHQRQKGAYYKSAVAKGLHPKLNKFPKLATQKYHFCVETFCKNDWTRHLYECPITAEALKFVNDCLEQVEEFRRKTLGLSSVKYEFQNVDFLDLKTLEQHLIPNNEGEYSYPSMMDMINRNNCGKIKGFL